MDFPEKLLWLEWELEAEAGLCWLCSCEQTRTTLATVAECWPGGGEVSGRQWPGPGAGPGCPRSAGQALWARADQGFWKLGDRWVEKAGLLDQLPVLLLTDHQPACPQGG